MSNGPGKRDAYAAAQRDIARRLHPDLGGDPQQYVAAMAALDGEYRDQESLRAPDQEQRGGSGVVHVVARRRVRSAVRSRARRTVASVRGALPRGLPGARRYGRL